MIYRLIHADVLDELRSLADDSIDSVATDPPYGLGFMGKEWDTFKPANVAKEMLRDTRTQKRRELYGGRESNAPSAAMAAARYDLSLTANRKFQDWCEVWARECLRVLKPGGHLLSFGGSRTYHRMACAIEDAGFEIRDQLQWLYGSGFPKSLDVSKAIDKAAGVAFSATPAAGVGFMGPDGPGGYNPTKQRLTREGDSTDEAQRWTGWGTALKPAHEPIVLARKPFRGNVAANVLQHGTGALNIGGCRIAGAKPDTTRGAGGQHGKLSPIGGQGRIEDDVAGRWPPNVLLDEAAAAILDDQCGELTSGSLTGQPRKENGVICGSAGATIGNPRFAHGSTGGASRFMYTAKAGRSEREEGLHGYGAEYEHSGPRGHSANGDGTPRPRPRPRQNHHPTVKPVDVMRWLVRLATPPGDVVLDPFTGSGTSGMAAIAESMNFIGIEREAEYVEIARQRIASIAPMFAKEAVGAESARLGLPFAPGSEQGGED